MLSSTYCGEVRVSNVNNKCFIPPLPTKELNENYIFYDFETRYENGRHVANFVCAITFKGEKFTAEATDCITLERAIRSIN